MTHVQFLSPFSWYSIYLTLEQQTFVAQNWLKVSNGLLTLVILVRLYLDLKFTSIIELHGYCSHIYRMK